MENLEVNTHETNVIDMCIKLAEMEKLTAMKIYMVVKGISTKGLADHFGLTSGAVNLWLLGKSIPHIRTHNKVAVSPKKELAGSKWKVEDFMVPLKIENYDNAKRLLEANYAEYKK